MKKILLTALVMSLLILPFFSGNGYATLRERIDEDTGVKATSPSDTVQIGWVWDTCKWNADNAIATVEYRSTSPKKVTGGFTGCDPECELPIIGTWESGIWTAYVEIDSWISGGDRGTNHGDIHITWPGFDDDVTWSFNVRHS